jgi:hypothetical protein
MFFENRSLPSREPAGTESLSFGIERLHLLTGAHFRTEVGTSSQGGSAVRKKVYLLLGAAALMVSLFGAARPAYAWSCSSLTDHSWLCTGGGGTGYWVVEYRDGGYIYHPF